MTNALSSEFSLFRPFGATVPVLGAALWLVTVSLSAEYRVFTNKDGDTIEARMVRIEDDLAVIERKDRRIFRYPIDRFSDEDQKYVRRWPALRGLGSKDRIEIRLRRSRLERNQERSSPQVDPDLDFRRTEEKFVYQIIFNNRTGDELEDVTVEYRIFKQRAAHMPGDRGRRIVKRGETTAEKIRRRGETTITTEPFLIIDTDREAWGPYNPQTGYYSVVRVRRSDSLDGIWIRIMDGDKIVREEYSSQNIPQRFNW